MKTFATLAAWLPAAQHWLGSPSPSKPDFQKLGARLSQEAQVFFPGSNGFQDAASQWSGVRAHNVRVVVVPATPEDVSETVKFANHFDVPFLASVSGHGTRTQRDMDGGILIRLNKLNTVDIAPDGKTAQFGGGITVKTAIETLWSANKQTVTGGCECVSMLGPGLGGGHGSLQGHYGTVTDQFVSLDVVLAHGRIQTINEESHPDLWWAMRGAGHNFGIVTSSEHKIYDVKHSNWALRSFIFDGDQVEELYGALNQHFVQRGNQSADIITTSFWLIVPDIDPDKPVIRLDIVQEGVKDIDSKYTKPLMDIKPISTTADVGDYTTIAKWQGVDVNSAPCTHRSRMDQAGFSLTLLEYNASAMRQSYDLFASTIKETPAFSTGSVVLIEGYSTKGIKAVPSESSAYPLRGENLIITPLMAWKEPELDKTARRVGEQMRQILYKGTGRKEMHTYVNYAHANESLENMYGYEPWRLEKLRSLKKKYDPKGRFSLYAPIA